MKRRDGNNDHVLLLWQCLTVIYVASRSLTSPLIKVVSVDEEQGPAKLPTRQFARSPISFMAATASSLAFPRNLFVATNSAKYLGQVGDTLKKLPGIWLRSLASQEPDPPMLMTRRQKEVSPQRRSCTAIFF